MARTSFKTSITKHGPFFQRDPAKTFRQNAHQMMQAVASVGAEDVRGQLRAGDSGRAPIKKLGDHVSGHVRGELRRRPHGPNYTATVFVENRGFSSEEGISLMAAASTVEGKVHAFRKTRGRISRARGVNTDELLDGIQ